MDNPVKVGVITAAVSVLTLAVNVFLASKSRSSEQSILLLKDRLEREAGAHRAIKQLEIESERLRIYSKRLAEYPPKIDPSSSTYSRFISQMDEFLEQARAVRLKWSEARSDIPEIFLNDLRNLRHRIETSHEFAEQFRFLLDDRAKQPNGAVLLQEFLDDYVTGLPESMTALSEVLEEFIVDLRSVRDQLQDKIKTK